ncbi:MAG: response regulator, partial [Pseudomonadales bacterium]
CLIDPLLPTQLLGDPTRVRQIVSNLLSNALKFTRFGRVDISVSTHNDGVRIIVRDTGIGIAEDAQARIFQPFAQAGVGITRQFGGTGLGLALTRRLCEAMRGQLSLETQEGFGSTFCVALPLPSQNHTQPLPVLHGRVIGLSPASSGLSEQLSRLLPAWGLHYQHQDADSVLGPLDADVLISDSPQRLNELRAHSSLPILVVSAYGNFLSSEQVENLAPIEQLARPLSRQVLLQALRRILGQGAAQAAEQHSEPQRSRRARVLLVEDNPVNQLVAKGMLGKLGCEVLLANHGGEALTLLETQTVDLILMDCNMPVMDGYETTRQIRQKSEFAELPIIALTANALSDERERCRAAGMDDYLAKPFRKDELAVLLDQWLSAIN